MCGGGRRLEREGKGEGGEGRGEGRGRGREREGRREGGWRGRGGKWEREVELMKTLKHTNLNKEVAAVQKLHITAIPRAALPGTRELE